jgi:hypothetical protein
MGIDAQQGDGLIGSEIDHRIAVIGMRVVQNILDRTGDGFGEDQIIATLEVGNLVIAPELAGEDEIVTAAATRSGYRLPNRHRGDHDHPWRRSGRPPECRRSSRTSTNP